MKKKLFDKILIIGVGLIGSSIARALKSYQIVNEVIGYDVSNNVKEKCKSLGITDSFIDSLYSSLNQFGEIEKLNENNSNINYEDNNINFEILLENLI